MPLPPLLLPKPLEEPEEDPRLPELEEERPALPRVPADVDPALRLNADDPELLDTDGALLPVEAALTAPATAAALAVAAPAESEAADADLLVAATPPPVPDDWPETA